MSPAEVAQMRFDLENIRCKGRSCPNPIKTWSQVCVTSTLCGCVRPAGRAALVCCGGCV
jgi:hypothetical protein